MRSIGGAWRNTFDVLNHSHYFSIPYIYEMKIQLGALYICIEGLKITGGLAADPCMVHDWDAISNNKSTMRDTAGNTIQWSNQLT